MQTPLPHQFRQQRPFPIPLQTPPARPPHHPRQVPPLPRWSLIAVAALLWTSTSRTRPSVDPSHGSPQTIPSPGSTVDLPPQSPAESLPRPGRAPHCLEGTDCLPATLSVFIFLHLPLLHFSPSLLHFLQGSQPPSMSCQTHPFSRSSLLASTSSPALPRYLPSGTGRGAQGAGATPGFGSHSARTRSCAPPPPLTVS